MALSTMDSIDGQRVSLTSLRGYLKTAEWQDLDDVGSSLYKFLNTSAFKKRGYDEDELDRFAL